MDTRDLGHEFAKKKHDIAKKLTKEPKRDFWSMYWLMLGLTWVADVPTLILDAHTDDHVTAQTEQVQGEFQNRLDVLASQTSTTQEDAKSFVTDILLAEDLSEEQAYDFLDAFDETVFDVETAFGHDIGDIGDLRESRAEHPGDAVAIAKATVDAERPDNVFRGIDAILTLFFMGWLLKRGTGSLMRRSRTLNKWADDAPRHPRFKH